MPSRATISLDAIGNNYKKLLSLTGNRRRILCIVKADAYGHGAGPVCLKLSQSGARDFAVATMREAMQLRDAGIAEKIIVIEGIEPYLEEEAINHDFVPMVSTRAQLLRWNNAGRIRDYKLPCQLLFNTGMNRLGIDFVPDQESKGISILEALAGCKWIDVEGVATHFASAEDLSTGQTSQQSNLFVRQLAALRAAGFRPKHIHVSNSAAIVHHGMESLQAEKECTMVRAGLALYGYVNPASTTLLQQATPFTPALEWHAPLLDIKDVPQGSFLGYGATFEALRPMRIGVLKVGYADGLDWRLSNRGMVSLDNVICKIVGQISMDLTLVDLSEVENPKIGNEAMLLGSEPYNAQGMADLIGTVPYAVLCGIRNRVERVYE